MDTTILIVGGGLAGLALTDRLQHEGRDWRLIEAQDRLGGRVLTQTINGAAFDLGPAWFWPGQPRMHAMAQRFGLQVFEQYSKGAQVFQDQTGAVRVNRGYASMQGALRLGGGMAALVDALAAGLPDDKLVTGARLTRLQQTGTGVVATVGGQQITASKVILAVPPRVLAQTVTFSPSLSDAELAAMRAIPTWMAGHAKVLAVYDKPYWRDAGFSGDAMSQTGPLVEIHDASPAFGGPYGLFGFVGYPAAVRADHVDLIVARTKEQLAAMFGVAMADPVEILMQDWARAPEVATRQDWVSFGAHPAYGLPDGLGNLWSGQITLASTETGNTFGGFLEGALEAAEAVTLND